MQRAAVLLTLTMLAACASERPYYDCTRVLGRGEGCDRVELCMAIVERTNPVTGRILELEVTRTWLDHYEDGQDDPWVYECRTESCDAAVVAVLDEACD